MTEKLNILVLSEDDVVIDAIKENFSNIDIFTKSEDVNFKNYFVVLDNFKK
jgi:hypothetical protein